MTVDRMSPLDASFLHMEDNVSHMHIGSVAVFAGPPPPFAEVRAMLRGKLALVPRYRQVARFVPFDLGRPVWVDDEHFNLEYHLRHTALPSPGSEEQLRLLVVPPHGPPARPRPPALGDVDGRGPRGRPLGDRVQGPPRHRRRGVRRRAAVHHHGPLPRAVAARPRPLGARAGAVVARSSPPRRSPTWPAAPTSSSAPPRRAARAPPRAGAARRRCCTACGRCRTWRSRRRSPRSTAPSARTGATPGPTITVAQIKHVREHVGGTFNDVVLAAITRWLPRLLLARGESVDRVVRTLVPVSVRPRDASGVAVGDGVQENRVSAMFADLPIELDRPRRAPRGGVRADGRAQGLEAGHGRRGAHVAHRVRAAAAPRAGRSDHGPCPTAQPQHGHHQRARAAAPALLPRPAGCEKAYRLRAPHGPHPGGRRHLLLQRRAHLRRHRRLRHHRRHRGAVPRHRAVDAGAARPGRRRRPSGGQGRRDTPRPRAKPKARTATEGQSRPAASASNKRRAAGSRPCRWPCAAPRRPAAARAAACRWPRAPAAAASTSATPTCGTDRCARPRPRPAGRSARRARRTPGSRRCPGRP